MVHGQPYPHLCQHQLQHQELSMTGPLPLQNMTEPGVVMQEMPLLELE